MGFDKGTHASFLAQDEQGRLPGWDGVSSYLGWTMGQNRLNIAIRKGDPLSLEGLLQRENLLHAVYVGQFMRYNICAANCVVQTTWCHLCGTI
eukprot:3183826-Pyramimonas_sp.AAC.1